MVEIRLGLVAVTERAATPLRKPKYRTLVSDRASIEKERVHP